MSLNNPQKVSYQYKLEGFDKDWLPGMTKASEAVYSNLPPGTYTFLVRAFNNNGAGTFSTPIFGGAGTHSMTATFSDGYVKTFSITVT